MEAARGAKAERLARWLVREHGTTLAQQAGITLRDEPDELWQLLVMAQLLSARIPSATALASARELWRSGWTSPGSLRASTWNQRVAALGRGGYRRYDFSTATQLDGCASLLLDEWEDDLRRLREQADGEPGAISRQLQRFPGIGPVGASIFLREVQGVWPTVAPQVDRLVTKGAGLAGLDPSELPALVGPDEFVRLCAALVTVARRASLLSDAPSS